MAEYQFVHEEVFTVSDFLTAQECAAYIDLAESIGFDEAPITTSRGPVMNKQVRNNDRVMLDDEERGEELWRRCRPYVPLTFKERRAVGVNERLRFYRYQPGQQFDWHYDGCFARPSGERSFWTFMIYLNDDFRGGETSFDLEGMTGGLKIQPKTGLALFFHHPNLHKGEPVIQGRKYVLRTDVMYSR